jgi:hypothetical protein
MWTAQIVNSFIPHLLSFHPVLMFPEHCFQTLVVLCASVKVRDGISVPGKINGKVKDN